MTILKEKIENFKFVEGSLYWVHRALVEISLLNQERPSEEIKLVNGTPFVFYRISLHYMFTMEYVKLMEKNVTGYPKRHYASLDKLSLAIYDAQGSSFERQHQDNLAMLDTIRRSKFYGKVKNDRDKKFAHSDGDHDQILSFKSFNDTELKEAFNQIDIIKKIMANCTKEFGFHFDFQHVDSRTNNFIRFHANYKRYYHDHYLDAVSKGYR